MATPWPAVDAVRCSVLDRHATAGAPAALQQSGLAGRTLVLELPIALRVGLFRTFGRNALAAYVLHSLVFAAVKPYVPRDAPGWYAAAGFGIAFAITYLLVRHLEKNEIYLKL